LYKYILFDLDETLYPRSAGLMQEIGARITRYLIERVGFSPETAQLKRRHYYTTYGTALRGLMLEESVDREDYLTFVHDCDLAAYIRADADLEAMLGRIPLTKTIFTNATQEHARRVLEMLGVAHHFARIVDIRATDFICKPDPAAYRRSLDLLGAQAGECILVEDNPRNLLPAGALGMTTILVDHADCAEVDHCVSSILEVGDVVTRALKRLDPRMHTNNRED